MIAQAVTRSRQAPRLGSRWSQSADRDMRYQEHSPEKMLPGIDG